MALIDSYSETNQNTVWPMYYNHPGGGAAVCCMGQSFDGGGYNITSCKFYLKKEGTPGNMIARLYSHTGTFGTSSVPNDEDVLDSSNTADADAVLTTSLALYEFTGFAGYTMVDGTKYVIAVEQVSGGALSTDGVVVGADSTSPTHEGNGCHDQWTWSSHADDTCFYIYGDLAVSAPTVTTQAVSSIGLD